MVKASLVIVRVSVVVAFIKVVISLVIAPNFDGSNYNRANLNGDSDCQVIVL